MKWGLIALNGTVVSYEKLKKQIVRYTETGKFDWVIGVDGGCKVLENLEYKADVILGDFDSIGNLERFKSLWVDAEIKMFPSEKDFTDAELAFDEMAAKDLDRIVVVGGFGGRADHMLSILYLLGRECKFVMIDELNYIEKIEGPIKKRLNKLDFHNTYVSIMPIRDQLEGVNLSGFRYPLTNAIIKLSQTLGISNEIIADEATIEIQKGTGFIVFSQDE